MHCVLCGAPVGIGQVWGHLRSRHLEPLNLTPGKLWDYARKIAGPLEMKSGELTCLKLPEKIIYFSLENAELLIAFAWEEAGLPWTEVVEWQILHEKGHLQCQGSYQAAPGTKPYILVNVEDYLINKFLLPEKYWPVCLANARLAVRIRNLFPVPSALRDGYFYCTQATFLAYGAVTGADLRFCRPGEIHFTEILSRLFLKIEQAADLPLVASLIGETFSRFYPPGGGFRETWES